MFALTLFAWFASAAAAWSLWRRVLDARARRDARPGLEHGEARRAAALGHAALLGVLVGLAVMEDRAPLATAVAACVAWAAVTVWMARGTTERPGDAGGARRKAGVALALAVLPVVAGAVVASGRSGPDGVAPLLAGWFVASAGVPLWVRLTGRLPEPPVAAELAATPPTERPVTPPPLPSSPPLPPLGDDPAFSPWP